MIISKFLKNRLKLANGDVFGQKTKISLRMLEVPAAMKKLTGVEMEIEDGAYPLLEELIATDSLEKACEDLDYAVLIGGHSVVGTWQNFERSSLFDQLTFLFFKSVLSAFI